jgi:hypothetical protein
MNLRMAFSSRRIGLLIFLVTLVSLFLAKPAGAQAKVYYWESFDVQVSVQDDGSLLVTEVQTLNFSGDTFTFGYRDIPINSYGRNDGITDISIREGDIIYQESSSQAQYTFETMTSGNVLTIWWYFPPALGTHAYTLSYRVLGGVRTEPSGNQVYWNAMPADLGSSIYAGRVLMSVPEAIQILSTTASVGGAENAGITTELAPDGRQVLFTLTEPRPAGNDVETGIRFPAEQLVVDTPDWQRSEQVRDVLGLLVLLASGIFVVLGPTVVLLMWYLRGRDPELRTPAPAYLSEPPDNTPPAVVGTLVDEQATIRDIASTLIDLARRGYMTMTEEKSDFEFTRTGKSTEDLKQFERKTFNAVFGKRESRSLNSMRYKFSSKLPDIRRELYNELVAAGHINASPEGTRTRYTVLGGLLLAAAAGAFFLGFSLLNAAIATAICPAFAIGVTGVTLIFVGRHMPRKTQKGAEAAANWMAFKKYLEEIERYDNLATSGEIFERYLAYAVAFGIDRTWIRKFSQTPGTPIPTWYHPVFYPVAGRQSGGHSVSGGGMPSLEGMSGSLTGGLESMSSGLTRMLSSTQTVMQSVKSSSSSSGGGGFSGGFSGGSSGGGGGGFG